METRISSGTDEPLGSNGDFNFSPSFARKEGPGQAPWMQVGKKSKAEELGRTGICARK